MEVVVRVSELVKVVILRMSELVKVAIVIEVVVGVLELVNDVVVLVVTDVTVVCVTVVVVKVVVVEVIVKVLVLVKDAVETVVVLIHHRSTVYAKRWLTLWCIAEQRYGLFVGVSSTRPLSRATHTKFISWSTSCKTGCSSPRSSKSVGHFNALAADRASTGNAHWALACDRRAG
jgi:hypothetical protein